MSPGDLIAGYAAFVATASLVWQALTRWSDRRPRLRLDLEFCIVIGHPVGQNEPYAAPISQIAEQFTPHWFFDIHLSNVGRSRFQVVGLDVSQTGPRGRVKWDTKHRLREGAWLDPGGRRTYRFRDADLEEASPNEPFQVIATVSPNRKYEITHKHEDGLRVFLHREWAIQFLNQLGIDNLEQTAKDGLKLLGIDNLKQWDKDSLRRFGIVDSGVTITTATDLYG